MKQKNFLKLSKVILYSFILFLSLSNTLNATDLNKGDLFYTMVNTDGDDNFSFVLLKDISGTTTVYFTDNGWDPVANTWIPVTEGTLTWTYTGNLTAGTEINITKPRFSTVAVSLGSITRTGPFSLSGTGDVIIAYRGTLDNPTEFIAAFNTRGNGWPTTPNVPTPSGVESGLPTGLTNGLNALGTTTHKDDWRYLCASGSTGDVTTLRGLLTNESKWEKGESVYTPPNCSITIGSANSAPTDISLTPPSVNQTATGVNATIGTLSSTDADGGDTHTYSLVAGSGATHNGSFNISGTTLRSSSALTAGTYNVRINTYDGTDNFAKAISVTVVDNTAPTVSSVTVPSNATYTTSQNLDFTINFNENITVDTTGGTPQLAVTIGSTARQASYVSGSGSTALLFRYTVQSDESDSDGIAVGALASNGGTLRDAASNNATLTLNSVGATSSVLVDSTAPTFENSTPATDNVEDIYFRIDIDLDEAGKAYYVVLTDGATAPTSAEVKAGTGSGGASVTTSGSNTSISDTGKFHATSVTAATNYDVYVVAEDNNGNLQASPTKLDVTTAAASINFRWTTASGTNTVTETVNGVTATVTNTNGDAAFNNLNDTAGTSYNLIGSVGFNTSQTITFNKSINLTSILVVNFVSASEEWIFTPTGGTNSAVESGNLIQNTATVVNLNWTNITSFTITKKGGGTSLYAFDEIVVTPVSKPTISSSAATSITANAATLNGNVTADGGATITERGFVYAKTSDNNDPEISGSNVTKQTVTGTTGTFNFAASSLSSSTQYSFKSYAKNSAGTSYGSVLTFTTSNTIPTLTAFSGSVISTNDNTTAEITFADLKAKGDENDDVSVDAFIVKSFPSNGTLKIGTSSGTATDYDSSTNNTIDATKNAYFISTENLNGSYNIFTVVAKDNVGAESSTAIQVPITINDATTPTVLEVTSDKTNGTYGVGTAINIYVQYSEEVLVTGTPQLTLETGTTDRVINYVDRSSSTLRFVYTVQTGDESADLDVLSSSALSLNSGTIKDAANNIASLTVQQGATAGSLSQNKDLVINATVPVVSTTDATSIAQQSATLAGNVTSIGGSAVTERGILYSITSTNAAPVVGGSGVTKDTNGTGSGVYTESITGLTPSTQYSFVAYAINSSGTVYGTVKTFTTSALLTPTITFANISKTYGDANFDLNATSNSSGTISYSIVGSNNGTSLSGTNNKTVALGNATTVTIRASQTANGIYKAETKDITLTINKATLTVTTGDKSREYGDANPTFTITYSGFKGSDDASSLDSAPSVASTATSTTNVGNVDITVSGGSDTNYDFSYTNGTLTINKVSLTATADDKSREYGDSNPTFTITYSGFKGSDDASSLDTAPSATSTAIATTNVGSVDITASGGSDTNYDFSYTNGALTINKRAITVSADGGLQKLVGNADPVFTYSITVGNVVNGDSPTGVLRRSPGESFGNYAINLGTLNYGTNYNTTFVGSTFNISFVITTGTSAVSATSAAITGESPITGVSERGVLYSSTNTDPQVGGNDVTKVVDNTTIGPFNVTITGLDPSTKYYFRTYVILTTDGGKRNTTQYGTIKSVITPASEPMSTSYSPIDNSTLINPTSNLNITFDKDIQKGTGDIEIRKKSDNSLIETIDVVSANVTINSNEAIINPTIDLPQTTEVYIQIPIGAFKDLVDNNWSGIADTETWSFTTSDTFGPVITNLTPLDEATIVNPTSDLVITFDEPITKGTGNITINDDINSVIISTIDIATSTNISISGNTLTISGLTLPERNDIYILMDSGTVKDASNNNFGGINVKTVWNFSTGDITSPTVTISSTNQNPTNQNIAATFTFNEDVTGFDISDIIIGNGTASNFIAVDKKIYTATITPINDGEVTIDVNANVAKDDYNNDNTAATQFNINYDNTRPSVIISSDKNVATNTAFTVTATFSEDVTRFDVNDITITNATISNFTAVNGKEYTATITPINQGNLTIDIDENKAFDAARNKNTAADQFTLIYDTVAPTLVLSSAVGTYTNDSFTINATFSEDITDFDVSDLTLVNATATNFNVVNAKEYSVTINPTADGEVTIDVNADLAQDAATNQNTASNQIKTIYDNTIPSVRIVSSVPNHINTNSFNIIVKFSEYVYGFDVNKITLSNATISDFTIISANEYSAKITVISEGEATVNILANVAQDAATNQNTASTNLVKTIFDNTKPTVIISSSVPNPTNSNFTAKFTFSENVSGFDINDIVLANANASNFSILSAYEYTSLITPITDGEITIDINTNAGIDASANPNTAATQFKTVYDSTKPIAPIITSLSDYTCAGNTSITGDNKIILYGTAEANSMVTLSINGVPKANILVDASGNWFYDNTAFILPDNVYLFTAKTTDSAGNVSDFSNQFNISINTADNDADGNPDFCDTDDDNDGVLDGDDNSPLIPNPGQEDTDGDGVADVDEDCDNDGIINYYDTDNSDCTTTIAQKKKYGFSPNGDGINDNWTIDNIELYPNNVVKVYNRSGRLVYRVYGYKNTWNGISNLLDGNNKKLPSGPYLYIIELNKDNQKPIQGWLYINY